jgi:hypothetical protein
MLQVPPPVATIDFIDGEEFILTQPYRYVVGRSGLAVEVPAGFVTDYASIPPIGRWLLGKQGRYSRAAVVHDYLYWSRMCTRAQADNLMLIAMKELDVPVLQRNGIHAALDWFGGPAWTSNAAERANGRPKVVPPSRYTLATHNTWPQARAILRQEGVRDPAFPTSHPVCALGNSQEVP